MGCHQELGTLHGVPPGLGDTADDVTSPEDALWDATRAGDATDDIIRVWGRSMGCHRGLVTPPMTSSWPGDILVVAEQCFD